MVVLAKQKFHLVNGGIVAEEGTTDMTEGEDHLVLEDETQRGDALQVIKLYKNLAQVQVI